MAATQSTNEREERRRSADVRPNGRRSDRLAREWLGQRQASATVADHVTTYAASLRSIAVDEIRTEDVLKPCSSRSGRRNTRQQSACAAGSRRCWMPPRRATCARARTPPAWRGNLDHLLLTSKKPVRRHPAMPIDDVPAFISRLRETTSVAARCMEFAILTASRSSEAIGARWDEIDFAARIWTVPGFDPETGRRMKAGRDHRVPLSSRALEILRELEVVKSGPFVFPGRVQASLFLETSYVR